MADSPSLADLKRRHAAALKLIAELQARDDRKAAGIEAAEKHLREIRDDREHVAERIAAGAARPGDLALERELDDEARDVFDKIAARHDERHDLHERLTDLERKANIAEARIEKRRGRKLDTIDCLDGCAMPRGHKIALLDARENGWGGRVNSGDRTPANCDHCSNKLSQAELWAAFQNGTGAPANPPASLCSTCGGTHEYVNDGTAYPGEPKGKRGPWWWMGVDASDGDELVAVLTRLGYRVRRPYPAEPWHVNFVGDPTPVLRERGRI